MLELCWMWLPRHMRLGLCLCSKSGRDRGGQAHSVHKPARHYASVRWNRAWNISERGNSVSVIIHPTTGALWLGPWDGLPAVKVLQSATASRTMELQLPRTARAATQAQLLLPTHSSRQNSSGDHAECSNMRSCPACLTMVWQSQTQDFKQKTFIKEVKRKSNKKQNPETIMYFPACFPFFNH